MADRRKQWFDKDPHSERVNGHTTEYIRLDLYTAVCAERDEWRRRHFKARDERDKLSIASKNYAEFSHTWRSRAEKAEAKVEKWKQAFAAQSRKLQSVLHIEGVRLALQENQDD